MTYAKLAKISKQPIADIFAADPKLGVLLEALARIGGTTPKMVRGKMEVVWYGVRYESTWTCAIGHIQFHLIAMCDGTPNVPIKKGIDNERVEAYRYSYTAAGSICLESSPDVEGDETRLDAICAELPEHAEMLRGAYSAPVLEEQ